jgi:hypothetical protein
MFYETSGIHDMIKITTNSDELRLDMNSTSHFSLANLLLATNVITPQENESGVTVNLTICLDKQAGLLNESIIKVHYNETSIDQELGMVLIRTTMAGDGYPHDVQGITSSDQVSDIEMQLAFTRIMNISLLVITTTMIVGVLFMARRMR